MGFCSRIKTDRVIYDERIFVTETEPAIPIGVDVPVGSIIDPLTSTVSVSVVECDLTLDIAGAITGATVTLDVQKDISIIVPAPAPPISLEYSFQRAFPVVFAKIADATIDPADVPRARCQIVEIAATDTLALILVPTPSLSETLLVQMKLKIVVEDQILVALCPPNLSTTATLNLPIPI